MPRTLPALHGQVYEFDGSQWREDMGWTKVLNGASWNVKVAREASYKALGQVRTFHVGDWGVNTLFTTMALPCVRSCC